MRTFPFMHGLSSYSAVFLLTLEIWHFSIYCLFMFHNWKHLNTDSRMYRRESTTAIQFPWCKVVPNLIQGQKQICNHNLWGAAFVPPAPVPPFSSFQTWVLGENCFSQWKHFGTWEGRGLDHRLEGKGWKARGWVHNVHNSCSVAPPNIQRLCGTPIILPLPPPTTLLPFSLPHPPVPWQLYTEATQRNSHTENRISMSLPWPWGEVSNISFQGDNDSSFNSPYFTACPNEYIVWVILIEHQPASGIMTLTVLSRFDDLMTMDLLIYPEICSTSFIKT